MRKVNMRKRGFEVTTPVDACTKHLLESPFLCSMGGRPLPTVQIEIGDYHVPACLSTIHSRTWLTRDYAKLAGIDLSGKSKLLTEFPWSEDKPARVYETNKLGFMGKKISCKVLVCDAVPESMPPILGVDFLSQLADVTLCPSDELVFMGGETKKWDSNNIEFI